MSKQLKIIPAHGDIVVCPFCGQELLSDYDQASHWNSLAGNGDACRGESDARRVAKLHVDDHEFIHVVRDSDGDLWALLEYPDYDTTMILRPEPLTPALAELHLTQVGSLHDEMIKEIHNDQDQVRLFNQAFAKWKGD